MTNRADVDEQLGDPIETSGVLGVVGVQGPVGEPAFDDGVSLIFLNFNYLDLVQLQQQSS